MLISAGSLENQVASAIIRIWSAESKGFGHGFVQVTQSLVKTTLANLDVCDQ